ncbi:MAG: hypothetical protein ABIT37_22865 [Luteolibacter sp.]
MATFQHPASLNPLQRFAQACSILKLTTRAVNPGWYQEALELDFQLHIRKDGASISTFYLNRPKNQWSPGPTLQEEVFQDPAKTAALAAESLAVARSFGANALGVILHIADEFATTELKPELDNPSALFELRDAAISNPGSILDDNSIQADLYSWRVLPYPAAGGEVIGTTATLSRQYAPFIEALRQAGEVANFPILSHALSAPLVAILGLSHRVVPTPGKPFVAILLYPWLTAMAFFNEHADLRLIRTLQHRGMRRATNFRNALATTNASLEFIDPDIFILPLGQNVDQTLDADLRITFNTSRVEIIDQPLIEGIPSWCPEPAISTLPPDQRPSLVSSHTFTILREEKWAIQNFLSTPKEIVEIYPDRSEMRLLRLLRLGQVAILALSILSLVYSGYGVIGIISRPEWSFDQTQADASKGRLAKLTTETKKAEHWNNLLEDRSKAWTSMESLARLFPANCGMLVDTYSHAAKPDMMPGKAKVGFVKEWKITGYAQDQALDYLNTINTREGITAHFSEIARITGNTSFSSNAGNRNLVVNVRTQENTGYKPAPPEEGTTMDRSNYPFSFEMTIIQRFEATDPMAINVAKAP